MILLYSGANTPNQPQPQPIQSVGGYISNSLVPSGTLNNIFPDLTKNFSEGLVVTRMVVLKNTTGVTKTSLSIFTELDSEEFEIKIGGVLPALDGCGVPFFEQLQNGNSLPYQATLSVKDEANPILVSSLDSDKLIGIWISLSKKTTETPSLVPTVCSKEGIEQLRADSLKKILSTNFSLKISYT